MGGRGPKDVATAIVLYNRPGFVGVGGRIEDINSYVRAVSEIDYAVTGDAVVRGVSFTLDGAAATVIA